MPSSLIGQCSQLCWLSTSTSSTTAAAASASGLVRCLFWWWWPQTQVTRAEHASNLRRSFTITVIEKALTRAFSWVERRRRSQKNSLQCSTSPAQRSEIVNLLYTAITWTQQCTEYMFSLFLYRYNFIPAWFIIGCKICKYRQFVW